MNQNSLVAILSALQPEAVIWTAAEKATWHQRWVWWVLLVFPVGFASLAPFAICLGQKISGPASGLALIVAAIFNAIVLTIGRRIFVRLTAAKAQFDHAWLSARQWRSWYYALVTVAYAGGQKLLVFVHRKTGNVVSCLVRDDAEGVAALRKFLLQYRIEASDALAVAVTAEFSNPLIVDRDYRDLLDLIQGRVGIVLRGSQSTPKELVAVATQFITDSLKTGVRWQ